MNTKAVLFDMNGVIVDDEPLHMAAFQEVLQSKGLPLSDEQYMHHFAGKTDIDGFKSYMTKYNLDYSIEELMKEKAQAYLAMAKNTLKPYKGVVELIAALHASGTPLALVTSSLRSEAEVALETFQIKDFFTIIITADDIRYGKPNPEGYLKAADALHVSPSECTVIEDAPSGVAAAKAAGMRCIAVLNTHFKSQLKDANILAERLDKSTVALL